MRKIVEALFHGERWHRDDVYIARRRLSSLAPGAWEAVAAARFRRPKELQDSRPPSAIEYGRISADTLIIAGEQDKIKPFGWWKELTAQMARAKVVLIPDAGHCPQLEMPERVNEALIDFLKNA
jgi:pimeloyl-ACP methyl ester carboxylesterase